MVRSVTAFVKLWACASSAVVYTLCAPPSAAGAEGTGEAELVRAVDAAIELEWAGSCMERRALAEAVARALEQPRFDSTLRVVITGGEAPRLNASFSLWRGQRQLSLRTFQEVPGDCEDMRSALSLAIALGISGASQEPAPPPSSGQAAATPAHRPALAASERRLTLWGEPLAMYGAATGLATGAAAGLGIEQRRFSLGGGLLGVLPRSTPLAEGSVRQSRGGARVHACLRASGAWLEPRLCAVAVLGVAWARGAGYAEDRTTFGAWATFSMRASLLWAASERLRVGPSVEGVGWLAHPRFVLRDSSGAAVGALATERFGLTMALTFEAVL